MHYKVKLPHLKVTFSNALDSFKYIYCEKAVKECLYLKNRKKYVVFTRDIA
jgi:hypothetical protein